MKHILNLQPEPFAAILSGTKCIESRLFDEKRKLIAVGDNIEFRSSHTDKVCLAEVTVLHRHQNFAALFTDCGAEKFGKTAISDLLDEIHQFYTKEQIALYGVLGIECRLIAVE